MTDQPSISAADVSTLRDAAAQLVSRLGLAGYDNASFPHADASPASSTCSLWRGVFRVFQDLSLTARAICGCYA